MTSHHRSQRHPAFYDQVESYLLGLADAEDRAEALYVAVTAAYDVANGSAVRVTGEAESVAPVSDAALEHTIRAGRFKRGASTLDPASSEHKP